jgi:hypothetical protein
MYVSLETLRRAVGLVDRLAELDDPAGFAAVVLPGLATLVGCDLLVLIYAWQHHCRMSTSDWPHFGRTSKLDVAIS